MFRHLNKMEAQYLLTATDQVHTYTHLVGLRGLTRPKLALGDGAATRSTHRPGLKVLCSYS